MIKDIWEMVPNKKQIIMGVAGSSLSLAIIGGSIGWFVSTVEVYKGFTAIEIGMNHIHRYSKHDADTIKRHTQMLSMLPGQRNDESRWRSLKDDMRDLKRERRLIMDKDGNFLSDYHKDTWYEDRNDIKKEIDKLEIKMKTKSGQYQSGVQFASRDR